MVLTNRAESYKNQRYKELFPAFSVTGIFGKAKVSEIEKYKNFALKKF
jgi:hypothetical protein